MLMLWATDGGANIRLWSFSGFSLWPSPSLPDTFRIRIWWEDDTGAEYVVYDNGVAQNIAGDTIVVNDGK